MTHPLTLRAIRKENQMAYVEYFSDFVDDGEILSVLEDGMGDFVSLIEIVSDDFTAFPELEGIGYVLYREDDQGFKSVQLIKTVDELEEIRKQYTPREEESEDDVL